MIGRHCFGQPEIQEHCVGETKRGCEEKWDLNAPAAQNSSDSRSKNKSESKGGANQAHSFRTVLFSCDVGDVRLSGRDVSPGDSVENAAEEKHEDRFGKPQYEKANAGTNDREQQHGSAPISIRQPAEHG